MTAAAVETKLAKEVVERAARALAAADGYDWQYGKPEMQAEYSRVARVAVGAALEYMIEKKIRVLP